MQPTHIIKFVKPLYMPDLLKETMQEDINVSQLTAVMSNDSFDYIYRLISDDVEKNAHDFDELMSIIDKCRDMNLNQRCGDIISHIEKTPRLRIQYEAHKKASETDMSSADGSDNR